MLERKLFARKLCRYSVEIFFHDLIDFDLFPTYNIQVKYKNHGQDVQSQKEDTIINYHDTRNTENLLILHSSSLSVDSSLAEWI